MKLRLVSIVAAAAILAGAYPFVQVHLAAQGKGASQAEPDSDLDGTVEVVYEDGYTGPRLKHFMRVGTDRVELDFGGRGPRQLRTGSRIRARGKLRNGKLAVNPLDVAALGGDVAALGGGGGGESSTQALVSPYTFGVQPTLVILFNFTDLTQTPYSTALANTVTFTQVNNFDLENSFNQTSLSGQVVGWYTIASSATAQGCNYNTWATQAEAAATAAGVNLNLYPRRVFGFPQTSACAWWGLGTIGGGGTAATPSRAWINGTYSLRVVAHEMGHNFGLYHSQSRTCDTTNGCFIDEYGDDHDVMGGGPSSITGHFNAYQKERLGWLNYGSSPTMTNVNGSGQYALEPYAKPWTGGSKALKIVRSTGTSNTYLYAEARTSFGIDTGLPAGIVIHSGNDFDGSQIFEEDVQPTALPADFILDPGQSITFNDAVPPVTIQTLTATSTGATLQITQACMNSLGSSGQSFSDTGGPGTVALTTGTNCAWTATSDSAWLTVNGGSGSGTGSATINFTVAANPGTARTGTLTIAGQTFTVTQAANACLFTVTPLNPSVNHTAASYSVNVTATPTSCSWAATSNTPAWITVTAGASGTGNGTVTYSVTANASHTGHTGTLSVAGQTVTVFQDGLAGLFISPANGAVNIKTTNVMMLWTGQSGVQSYRLTVGTTVGAADVYDSGETGATNRTVPSMPTSRLLYARLRTTWPDAATPKQDITFTTVDRISGLQVLGSQSSNPVVAGGSTQYGASAANSVKVSFTGSQGNCTATFGANGLPAGATATFAPTSAASSATDQFTLLTVSTTSATVPGTYTFNVTAQESAACNTPAATVTVAGVPLVVFGSTSMSTATATGTYGGSAAVSATLTSGGTPLAGKSVSFTLNGHAVGSGTTDASGVATMASASLAGVNAGSFPSGVVASFVGDANYGASSANNALTVSQKSITPSVTAGNKAYDGTTSATLTGCTLSGVVGADVVTCSGSGTASFASAAIGTGKTVAANGLALSGAAAANYTLSTTTATTTANITAVSLTPAVTASNRTYDATTNATLTGCTLTGVLGGDVVTCSAPSATFATAAVGTGKTVTANGITLAGAQAGNYSLSTTTASTTANISAASVTPSVTAANKSYNGTASATMTACTLSGVIGVDVVTCSGTATFGSAGVGTGKTVTATGIALAGAQATNYVLSTTTATTTANIIAASVTPSVTAANKSYDATATATITACTLSGVIGADVVTCSGTATFATAAVGTGKTVTATGISLAGAQAANYALSTTTATTTANITGATVTPSITAASKPYNGNTSATLTGCTLSGVLGGDAVACTGGTATFATAAAGTAKTVTANGLTLSGAQAGNYSLSSTTATTTANIAAASVTPSVTAAARIYDGTTSATITACTLSGVVGGDVVTCSGTATFAAATVGTSKTVNASGITLAGADAANYALSATTATTTANITAATLAPAISATNKTYDGTASAAINCTLTGVVGGEVVTCSGTGSFDSIAVGTGKTVTSSNLALNGAAASNYVLSATSATTTANITAATVSPAITATNKTYNGTAAATVSCTLTGVVGGDVVTCSGTGTFDSIAVGTGKTVTSNNLALSGAAANNYALSATSAATTANITAVTLTPAITATNKTYDGTSSAAINCTLTGVIGGDVVACSGTGSFDSSAVGTGKTVTSSNLALNGAAASNYVLSAASAVTTANITAAMVTPAITATSKTYNSTSAATISCTLTGVLGGDAVTCSGTGTFDSIAVGTGKTVTSSNLTLSGAAASNYVLSATSATTTANITAATLTPAITATNKTYNGTSAATVSCTLTGVVGGDVVTCSGTGTFDSIAVGAGKTVTSSNLTLGSAAASNYVLSTTSATTTANITAATLTPAITAPSKTYDGTSSAAINCTLTGVVGGDVVTCSGTGTFDSIGVGIGKTVSSTNLALNGAAASNYVLSATGATTTANITAATLTPAITATNKAYDATASAAVSCTLTGVVGTDVVACVGTGSFDTASVGTGKTVTANGLTLSGTAASNYTLTATTATTTANITAATLTPAVTATTKTYDSTANAAISCTLTGVVGSDVVACAGTGSFDTASVGTGKTVTASGLALSGAAASNYALSATTATTTANITAATLTPAITATSKPYDGASSAAISCTLTGVVGSDVVACVGTGSFDSIAVGTGKTVTSINLALSGGAASNYALSATSATTTANITAATLTPAITATNKTYDGTSSAAVSCTLTGVVGSDVVACAGTGSFDSSAVGTGKTVTASALSLSGAAAANYALSATSATTTASITAATLTPAITATNKSYDATASAAISCTLTGVVGSDVVACVGTGSFDTAAVGTGKTVTANGLTLSGDAASNYALAATTATTTATITAATLTPAITATNKTYDGTSSVAISCTLTGVVGTDVVACAGTGSFDTAAVGTGKTVTANGISLSGAQATNYALSATSATTTANITAATLTPAITATSKTYDGTSSAAVSCTLTGVVGSDVVTCTGTGSFDTPAVGTAKTVTANGLSLSGAQAPNYALLATSATTTANVTAATLTPGITATSKTYDGTSSAAVSCTLTGVVGSDVVACAGTGSFDSSAVGTGKTVTASALSLSGAAAANYALSATSATTTASITAATLTPAITATNKSYDATASAAISCTLTGVVGSDVVACVGTGSFNTAAVGTGKTVTANGLTLSGDAASNYALATTSATTMASITAATLTPAITATNKSYDATASAAISCTLTGVVGSDVVACAGTGSFDTAAVGTGKTVTANAISLSGAQATNYALSATSATTTANITAATLTPAITATSRTYDGTSSAAVSCTLTGVVGSDVVTCTGTGSFDTPAVGTAKTVTANGLSLSGAQAPNYALSATSATTTANITAATLTPAITAASKTYDGTSSAAISCTVTGVVGSDAVTCLGTGSFDSSTVGTGKTVTANGLTLSGAQAANYELSANSAPTTANITAATLTPAITATSKTYDGTSSAAISCTVTGVVGSDAVTCVGTGSFDTTAVGMGKTVTSINLALSGGAASNYTLSATSATTTANITAATLTPAITAASKIYDATTSAAISCTLTGVVGTDGVACVGTGSFDTASVSTGKTVTANGLTLSGTQASNYALATTSATTTANITAATLTPAITATSKTYDGTSSAVISCTLTGVLGGDIVSCSSTGSFNTAAAGSGKTVTANGLSLSGAAAGNYALSTTSATTTANITAATLTPAITATNKAYDGTASAAISCTLTGVLGGDIVSCSGTGSFNTAAAGSGKTVTANGLSLSGAAAGNYALSTTSATTTANITAVSVMPAITATNKAYDGTASAAISCTLTGVLGGDIVSCSGTGSFNTAAAGSGKTVTANGLSLSGAAAGNYALSTTSATTTANITAVSVTPAITATNKTYDRTTSAAISCTLTGVLGGDIVSCNGTGSFNTAAVGSGKTVTANGLSLSGAAAGNYALSTTSATTTANITAAPVTPAITATNKTYNGNSNAAISCTLTGVIAGDVVTCSGTGSFASSAVGTGKTVTSSNLVLNGAAASNYALSATSATTTANITRKNVTPSVTAASKPYDGTTVAVLTACTVSGVVGGDVVACSGAAVFNSANVGTGKTVTASGLSLSGAAAGNYSLSTTTATTSASITAIEVTPSITVASKIYDGTIAANLTACTVTGVIAGDEVSCDGVALFDSAIVGTGKPVTTIDLELQGPQAGNYILSTTTVTATADITSVALTAAATVASRLYNGTTTATLTSCTLTGVVTDDIVTCSGTATFTTASVGTGKPVTITSLTLGGPSAQNYYLTSTTTATTASILALSVTPAITVANKTYDKTTGAALASCTLAAQVGVADAITVVWNANPVGDAIVGYWVLVGTAPGDYQQIFDAGPHPYFFYPNPVPGQEYFFAVSAYNDTGISPVTEISGSSAQATIPSGDDVACAGTPAFDTEVMGPSKTVTASDLTLTGAASTNYRLSTTTATTTATINGIGLTPTIAAASKTYDGTSTAAISCTLAGVVNGDDVTCSGTGTFDSVSAGTGKTVTSSNLVLSGAAAGNYTLSTTSAITTAAISAATLTPAITAVSRTYDGTPTAAISCTLTGVIGSDVVSCSGSGSFASAAVGSGKSVTASNLTLGGAQAGNYILSTTSATTTAAITTATLTPAITATSKTYDGSSTVAVSCTLTGVVGGDVVTCSGTGSFDSSAVGAAKTVTSSNLALGGAQAANYTLASTTATTTAAIARANATPVVAVASKVYDGTTSAVIVSCTVTGVIGADQVGCTGTAAFQDRTAGPGKMVVVTNLSLVGAAAANYELVDMSVEVQPLLSLFTSADITPASVTATVAAGDKVYDGAVAATLTSCTLSGVSAGDDVSCIGSATFATSNAGLGKAVAVSGLTLTGADAVNYVLAATTASTTASITPATLTPAITATSKAYDGTSSAAISCTLTGVVGSDAVTCAGTGSFDTAAVGSGKTVTASGLSLLGAAASNYALSSTAAATTANITAATLTPAITAANKAYDGTSSAAISCTLTGLVGGDIAACAGTGNFDTASVGTGKTVTANGLSLSGTAASNYELSATSATTTANITAATLTPAITATSKIYDGTSSAAISCTVTGVVGSDVVACGGTGSFDSFAVGTGKTVTAIGLSLSGAAASNYALSATSATTTANITAATLTPAITATSKTYDGTSSAAISCTLTGLVGGDIAACAGTGSFDTASVGTGKTVTANGLSLSGAAASNYALSATSATTTANITAATLTPAITATSKTYDGTSSAAISCTVTGVVGSDAVTCTGTASFDTAAVGSGKTVTANGLTLSGAQATNYALSAMSATTTANITAATLTPAITATNKIYDATASAAISCTLTGVVGTDVVACIGAGSFDSAVVGTGKTVTANAISLSGAQASNYALSATSATTTANITAATLTPAIAATNKTYDGTSSAAVSCTLTGVVGSDVVACAGAGSFDSSAVGTGKAVTANGLTLSGAQAANYELSANSATTTANITAATLTPAITATSKTYDGTSSAAISCTLTGVFGSDVVACSGAASFDTASVGTGKTVLASGITLSGAQATNYALSTTSATTTASITTAALTPAIAATSKTYDGTSSAAISCTLTGLVGGDIAACAGTGSFDTASVGTGKTVTANAISLSGAQASNYELSATSAMTTASITAATLTPAITATSKRYDGTSSAAISCTLTGVVASDAVTCAGTGSFDSSAVGTGKTVTANGLGLSGAAASNYALSATSAATTANITAAPLTPAITASSKPYDGTAAATLTACTVTGVIGTDAVGCAWTTAAFDTAAAGTGKTVTATGLTLNGASGNYALATTTATATAAISALNVTPTVIVSNKTYDGTMTAAVSSCAVSGLLGGDSVSCSGTALFESASAGVGKTVQISSLALTGPAASNYNLISTSAMSTATITPLSVTAAPVVASKVYDGTTAAALSNCAVQGALEGDAVTCAGSATFDTAAAGASKTVTITSLALNGAAASNYALSSTTVMSTGAITQRTATPTVTIANKRFDGTTSATITTCTLSGLIAGDAVICTGNAAFASAAVGSNKQVTVSQLALTGTAAANYVLSTTTVTVTASVTANTAPVITNPGAQAGYQSLPVALVLHASDADSDPLTWSAQALPPGIALSSTTGAFSGAPTTPGAFMTTVSAFDGFDTTQISFMWTVASAVPVAASPLSPSGSTATTTPTIAWSAVPLVEYYLLWIADSGADSPLQIWYTPSQASCATGGTCTVSLPRALKAGLVTWKVLTWNHFGYGPWSTTVSAVVDLADALVPTPATSAPSGPIATRIPTYSWSAVSNATWYQLSVTDALNVVREFWYTPAEACTVTSCAVTPITAVATGVGKWRVRAWRASGVGAWSAFVNFDAADSLPGKVTLVSPSGSVTTSTPTFTWLAMPTTSYYLLTVTDRDNVSYERWYRPGDAGCALGTGTCAVAPGIVLKAGTASWKVLTWNGKGYGPWSDTRDILIEIADASAPVPLTVSPTGTINSTTVPYRWTSVAGALNYRFSIRNNGGAPTYLWFSPGAAGCSAGGDCVVTPQITLTNGTAEWQVQAWTNNGYGGWSSPVALTVNMAAPLTPVLVSPNGTLGTAAPQLRWNASNNATLYYVRLFDSTGQRIDKWLSPSQAGCATGGVCTLNAGVTLAGGGGSWQVIAWNPSGYSPWSATMAFTVPQ